MACPLLLRRIESEEDDAMTGHPVVEGLIQEITQGRGDPSKVLMEHFSRGLFQNLRGTVVENSNPLIRANADDAAAHVR